MLYINKIKYVKHTEGTQLLSYEWYNWASQSTSMFCSLNRRCHGTIIPGT